MKYYSIQELSTLSGVSRQTIYNDINSGDLEYYRIGKRMKFDEAQMKKYVEQKENSYAVKRYGKYSVEDVCNLLSVSRSTLYNLIDLNQIKCVRSGKNGYYVHFTQKQVNDYLELAKNTK